MVHGTSSSHFQGARVQSLVRELKIPHVMCACLRAKWLQSGPTLWDPMEILDNPMDRGAWWATVHGVTKELDAEQLTLHFMETKRALN